MADSNITKRALAAALKELMETIPFEKITIAQICDKCDMNRISFYYHFKDKYDLVNWIYDTEFLSIILNDPSKDGWEFLSRLILYLYNNRSFYRKALKIKGQNSFYDHLRETLIPFFSETLHDSLSPCRSTDNLDPAFVHNFEIRFITDGIAAAIERWLLDKKDLPPEDFLSLTRSLIEKLAVRVCERQTTK